MTEPLNYCRQIRRQFGEALRVPSLPEAQAQRMSHIVDLCEAAQKFAMPPGGVLFSDPELRALDDSEAMKLPYPFVALEYSCPNIYPSRRVLFTRERDGFMIGTCVAWLDHMGMWGESSTFSLPTARYLDRERFAPDGGICLNIEGVGRGGEEFRGREPLVLLQFLNALACSNVHVELSERRKQGKKVKAALPFDTYHVLTIDVGRPNGDCVGVHGGTHRSPREHLRRGHIRRLPDGRRLWINATVVAAGRGAGVVSKDYAVRRTAP